VTVSGKALSAAIETGKSRRTSAMQFLLTFFFFKFKGFYKGCRRIQNKEYRNLPPCCRHALRPPVDVKTSDSIEFYFVVFVFFYRYGYDKV
jgi:hypothetical protein